MKIFDISYGLSNTMTIYEGDQPFRRTETLSLKKGGKATLSVITTGSHNGTHFDAPSHMLKNGKTIDRIDPALFFGPVLVVAIRDRKTITRAELESVDFRGIRKVLFKTRNSVLLEKNRPFKKEFVHLTEEAAEYLGKKKMELVGVDYLSVDRFHSGDHPAHRALLRNGVLILETVNLYRVPAGKYRLFAAPLLVKGGDSGLARAFLMK